MPSSNYYSIAVRVHQRERFACKRAAELAGMTVSAWSRKTLVGALHPTDFDAGDVHAEQPENAAQDVDAGVPGHGLSGEAVDTPQVEQCEGDVPVRSGDESSGDGMDGVVDAEGGSSAELLAVPGSYNRHAATNRSVQPLAFNKADLCPRCQRMGPSCQKCRALVRRLA